QRDVLARSMRYLPMLKLKQQQLQATALKTELMYRRALAAVGEAQARIEPYRALLNDLAGVNVKELSSPAEVITHTINIAGVKLPMLGEVRFAEPRYSLFSTPPWVDKAVSDLRKVSRSQVEADILDQQVRLRKELMRVIQRVNLFEKVMIPGAREAIRIIRIKLGDEQTAAVGRAKMAKGKLLEVVACSSEVRGEEVAGTAI
ncbi:MAG: V-type ATP synthase subunit D, partial [Planctomycetes bacterium]|nr:V-type ATP synthase subunit D [Planctomycetota bacterium]